MNNRRLTLYPIIEQYQYRTNERIKTIPNLGIVYYFHLYTKHCFCAVPRSIDIIPSLYPYKLPNRLYTMQRMGGLAITGGSKKDYHMI
jgi:hypothetical protein